MVVDHAGDETGTAACYHLDWLVSAPEDDHQVVASATPGISLASKSFGQNHSGSWLGTNHTQVLLTAYVQWELQDP